MKKNMMREKVEIELVFGDRDNLCFFFIDYMYFSCRPSSFPHKISRFFNKNIFFY